MQQTIPRPDSGQDSIEQIEARLDRDRAALGQAVQTLRLRLSGAALMQEGLALALGRGADTSRTRAGVKQPARWSSPVALGLAAMGLVWLTLGRGTKLAAPHAAVSVPDPVARWEDDGGMIRPLAVAQRPSSSPDWLVEADRLRAEAARLLATIRTASDHGISAEAELTDLRAEVLAALAADVRRVLARGLEGLPHAMQKAALLAREDAYIRHLAASGSGAQFLQDRPLVSGLLSFATGVAAGVMLPRSNTEDRQLVALRALFRTEALGLLQDAGWRQVTARSRG